MYNPDAMAETTVIIDPKGDVILLGNNPFDSSKIVRIRVSSTMMSYGSPVFRAMLSNRFKEGCELASFSTVEIQLLDDHPVPMASMCAVLHMRNFIVPKELHAFAVLQVAMLADKYDCVESLEYVARHWISKHLETTSLSIADRVSLLAAAYVLRQADVFSRMAHELLTKASGRIPDTHGQLPIVDAIISRINEERHACLRNIAGFVEEQIEEQCCLRAAHTSDIECHHLCTYAEVRSSSFMLQLKAHKLWPVTHLEHQSLSELLGRCSNLEIRWPTSLYRCDKHPPFTCVAKFAVSTTELTHIFVEKARQLASNPPHACLDCMLSGGEVLRVVNCPHGDANADTLADVLCKKHT